MSGWIKLHRKVLDNEIFRRDRTAWFLFEYLLLVCDKRTGTYTCGRNQLSQYTGIKPSTIYKSLKRLEKSEMVVLVTSQGQGYTSVKIANWNKYQSNSNKSVTSEEQVSNTKQELRIKNREQEYITTQELNELQNQFKTKSVFKEYESMKDYISATGKSYKDYKAMFRNWLRRSKDTRIPPRVFVPPNISEDSEGLNKLNNLKDKYKVGEL